MVKIIDNLVTQFQRSTCPQPNVNDCWRVKIPQKRPNNSEKFFSTFVPSNCISPDKEMKTGLATADAKWNAGYKDCRAMNSYIVTCHVHVSETRTIEKFKVSFSSEKALETITEISGLGLALLDVSFSTASLNCRECYFRRFSFDFYCHLA